MLRALIAVALVVAPCWDAAAQTAKLWRIGFLGIGSSRTPVWVSRVEAFRAGLRELGYVEGKNIAIEFRWADNDYDRLPGLAEELVRAKVDVIVTASTPGAMAAKKATRTIPIVLATVGDPLSTGVVANLAHPGGNVTGLAIFTPDEMAKRLELLKDTLPNVRRVAALFNPANPLGSKVTESAVKRAGEKLHVAVDIVHASSVGDFEKVYAVMIEKRVDAVLIFEDPLFSSEARKLAALAIKHRLPSIGSPPFADAGGLIGNGTDQVELFRRSAQFVNQILKGAKPGDLPIQQASRFELVVNMNTATALGLSIPKALQFRADRIIE
jgi:putative ABC transport system substrate-binding protein